jgi:hypothetical protein
LSTKAEKLAALLLSDREKPASSTHNIVPCFSCGYTFVYRGRQGELNGRFCSLRCQDWFDTGNLSYEQQQERERRPLAAPGHPIIRRGSEGYYIRCKGCNKEFESKGLRYCSKECGTAYRERQQNLATLAEAGIEPETKRQCETCGVTIPKWRNGRRVSKKTRYCSAKCKQKAYRESETTRGPLPSFVTI